MPLAEYQALIEPFLFVTVGEKVLFFSPLKKTIFLTCYLAILQGCEFTKPTASRDMKK